MTTKTDVLEWLQQHPVATVVTLSIDKEPQTAVVYTYIDEAYNCYFITKQFTRKYSNIQSNKVVALSWCDAAGLVTCEVSGDAHVVQDTKEVAMAITQLQSIVTKQKAGYWIPPAGQVEGDNYVVCKVVPRQVNFADYSSVAELEPQPELLEFTL